MSVLSGKIHAYQRSPIYRRALWAVFFFPAAWGFLFGIFHNLAQSGFAGPYDLMKSMALPMADALAPFFPAIDNVTNGFIAHSYGVRVEFGRGVAGMTAFFMTVYSIGGVAYCMVWRKGNVAYLRRVLRELRKNPTMERILCMQAAGVGMFGWAVYQMTAGNMLLDWDDERLSYFKSIVAFNRESWAAGVTMFIAVGGALLWLGGIIFLIPDTILISRKVNQRRSNRRKNKIGAPKEMPGSMPPNMAVAEGLR